MARKARDELKVGKGQKRKKQEKKRKRSEKDDSVLENTIVPSSDSEIEELLSARKKRTKAKTRARENKKEAKKKKESKRIRESTDSETSEDEKEAMERRRQEKKERKKRRKRESSSTSSSDSSEEEIDKFERLASIWRLDQRPEWMRKRSIVNSMPWKEIMDVRREHKEECRMNGMGDALFAADAALPTTSYKRASDNRAGKLHPASLLRLPIVEPEEYWRKLPTKREPVFRNLPLSHSNGNVVVNELTVVRMHDRTTPVTLKMLLDTNFAKRPAKDNNLIDGDWEGPTKLRGAQTALASYTAVLRNLWPQDGTPETLLQILVKYDWGGANRTDAGRAAMVEQLFNRVMIENARRAVSKKAPADYRRVKELWEEVVDCQPKATGNLEKQKGNEDNGGYNRIGRFEKNRRPTGIYHDIREKGRGRN